MPGQIRIVGAGDGLRPWREVPEEAGLVPGDALASKAFGVPRAGVEDDGEIRFHDGAELVHVALAADAGLYDPEGLVA